MSAEPCHGLPLLRYWRGVRRMSQLDLSARAGVSTRHISFIESGRARPSRWILDVLAESLQLPARDRNELLEQAGFSTQRERVALQGPALAQALAQLDGMLERMEPYPCLVLDRRTRILRANRVATALLSLMAPGIGDTTVAELILSPTVRPLVTNLESFAPALIWTLRRQAALDPSMQPVLDAVLADPTIPAAWKLATPEEPRVPVREIDLDMGLAFGGRTLRLLATTATLGTAADTTFDELWIETYLPRDGATDAALRAVAKAIDAGAPINAAPRSDPSPRPARG